MRANRKYGNRKVALDGMTFDSRKELARWRELLMLQMAGQIRGLSRQVKFELLPSQKEDGKVVERPVTYIADFVYSKDGTVIVEDVKGYKTQEYILKRKLLLYMHGIRINEV